MTAILWKSVFCRDQKLLCSNLYKSFFAASNTDYKAMRFPNILLQIFQRKNRLLMAQWLIYWRVQLYGLYLSATWLYFVPKQALWIGASYTFWRIENTRSMLVRAIFYWIKWFWFQNVLWIFYFNKLFTEKTQLKKFLNSNLLIMSFYRLLQEMHRKILYIIFLHFFILLTVHYYKKY